MSLDDRIKKLERLLERKRNQRLLELSRDLTRGVELEPYLQSIISSAVSFTGCEWASVLDFDEENKQLRFLAMPQYQKQNLKSLPVPIDGSFAGWVFKHGEPLRLDNIASDKRHFKTIDKLTGLETRSILAVPMVFKGQTVGVLETVNKADNSNYTEEDVLILETLASQAAIAVYSSRLENEIKKINEEKTLLDRMKSDFIAIASHELRTPLGLILGHSTFLREIVTEEFHEQLDTIIRNASRLKDIIENMSNVDNFQSGMAVIRQRTVSIKRLIEELVASFASDAKEKKLTLKTEFGKTDLMLEGDAEKIGISIGNLIKNAIAFTSEGGHVFISAEQIPGYIKISVVDDGVGIPAEDLPRIFERFYQVESHLTRKHGGMGLGLSVTKMMVEMHGGRITVESVQGKGSNFTIMLPLDSSQALAAQRVFIS